MLSKVKTLQGYELDSLDGEFGKVKEFYFDDQHWTIRYLVADTGNWLPGRQVLISPHALVTASKAEKHIALSREAIKQAPEYADALLLTREYEEGLHGHYKRPGYWSEEPTS